MWTVGTFSAVVLSGAIGISLGLIGGGGSIITVPVLVYVAGLPVREAVALSLVVVGTTAGIGAVFQARNGHVHTKAAIIYGSMGMAGAAIGARLTPLVPAPVLLTIFALLMIWVGLRMVRGNSEEDLPKQPECITWKCALAGLLIGVLTGFLGVGGGFLIVPALMRFAKMPMPLAIGTSLVIIAMNSLAGFVAHLSDVQSGISLAVALTAAAIAGLFAGMALGRRMQPRGLKTVFGGISLAVAAYLLVMNARPLWALLGS